MKSLIMKTPSFVVFSACVGGSNCEERTRELKRQLETLNLKFKKIKGSYKGTVEPGYYVEFATPLQLAQIEILANYFDQESILIVDTQRRAILKCLKDGTTETIGTFTQVPRYEIEGDYTYDFKNGGYYICK